MNSYLNDNINNDNINNNDDNNIWWGLYLISVCPGSNFQDIPTL